MLRSYLDGAVFGTASGAGPPRALLLHGWRRTKEDFAACAADLAGRGVAALALDLPGFGASPAPAAGMGARGYAALLGPLLGELAREPGPLLVVGHSFGGRVGVCLAAERPAEVAGLVLTGVPLVRGLLPRSRPSRRYQAIRALARRGLVPDAVLERARHRHGSDDYRAATGVMRDVLVATVAESYEAELGRVSCPTTLLWGSEDRTAPLTIAQRASELCDLARVEVLDGVGHLVPTEAPERLAAAASAMLEGAR